MSVDVRVDLVSKARIGSLAVLFVKRVRVIRKAGLQASSKETFIRFSDVDKPLI